MSDARRRWGLGRAVIGRAVIVRAVIARALMIGAVLCVAAPMTARAQARAQGRAELDARIGRMQVSIKATQARLNAVRQRVAVRLDDSLVSDGVTVLFPAAALRERDRDHVRDGIAAARHALDERFGAGASSILDGDLWSVSFPSSTRRTLDIGLLTAGRDPTGRQGVTIPMPIESARIEQYVLARAGRRLTAMNAGLGVFAAGAVSLEPQPRAYHVAYRQLVVSRSSVARRCATGVVIACRTILDDRAVAQWFDASDTLARGPRPVPRGVNASLVVFTLERGGAKALATLSAPRAAGDSLADPIALLADAAGTTPDQLLQAWNATLRAASDQSIAPSMLLVATAAFWSGVFLLVSTRRRPR